MRIAPPKVFETWPINRSGTPPNGALGETRTLNLQLRKLMLYPIELRAPVTSSVMRNIRFLGTIECCDHLRELPIELRGQINALILADGVVEGKINL